MLKVQWIKNLRQLIITPKARKRAKYNCLAAPMYNEVARETSLDRKLHENDDKAKLGRLNK